jgi:hypothetical protein
MHEQEFRDISSISISASSTSATTTAPPSSDSNLSPDRIIYIIVGTIFVFLFGTLLISVCRKVTRKQPEVENGSLISLNEIDGGDIFMEDLSQHRPDGPRFPTSLSAVQSPFHLTLPSSKRNTNKSDSQFSRGNSSLPKIGKSGDESTKNDEFQLHLDEIDDSRYIEENENEDDLLDDFSSHHSSHGSGNGSPNRSSKQSPSRSRSFRNNASFLSKKKKKRGKDKIDYESLVL